MFDNTMIYYHFKNCHYFIPKMKKEAMLISVKVGHLHNI